MHNQSHTPHRLQATLTTAQEAVAIILRKTLLVLIDHLLAVVRDFLNTDGSRSVLRRCLRRHAVGSLRDLQTKGRGTSASGRRTPRTSQLDAVKFHGSSSSRWLCGWPLVIAVRVAA